MKDYKGKVITPMNARAALRAFCWGKKKREVAIRIGWKPSYLSAFLNSRSAASFGTVERVCRLVGGAREV